MPEQQYRTLSKLLLHIKELIDNSLGGKRFWLKADVANVTFTRQGHVYVECAETIDGRIIAQCKAMIWANQMDVVKGSLGQDMSNILKKGAQIMMYVEVSFSEIYGFQIYILNIDRSFALGQLEQRKQQTFERLKDEQLIGKNKHTKLPVVVQKIAVIASPGTNGYADFTKQLAENIYGYKFSITDFPCQVQGEKAETDILKCLKQLRGSDYDAIVLIRGGGSKLDLEVYNSYLIAKMIAEHDRPVLTGIGHELDVSVVDHIAHQAFKTPTALGAFIVSRAHDYYTSMLTMYTAVMTHYEIYLEQEKHIIKEASTMFQALATSYTRLRRGSLQKLSSHIFAEVREHVSVQKQKMQTATQIIKAYPVNTISNRRSVIQETAELIKVHATQAITAKKRNVAFNTELLVLHAKRVVKAQDEYLKNTAMIIDLHHPDKTLQRGYAILREDGSQIKDTETLSTGAKIQIETLNHYIDATITAKKNKINKWKTLLTRVLPRS